MTSDMLEFARGHAPLLTLVLALAGASIAFVLPSVRLSWAAASAAILAAAAFACDLGGRRLLGAPLDRAQEGVALGVDGAAAFGAPLIALVSASLVFSAIASRDDFGKRAFPFAMALTIVVGAAWTGALLARDWTALFLATQTAWLASVALTALSGERDRGALNGALRMLGAGGAASALMLLGIGLIHRAMGASEVGALAVAQVAAPGAASVGVGLVLLGLALMAGVAPLHFWTGPAYGRAGGLAAAVIGALGAAGALVVLLRIAAHAIQSPELGEGVAVALAALGAVSVVVGSAQALGAINLRRLAGYACAAQAGGVLLAVALGSRAGFEAAFIQLTALAASVLALLAGAAAAGVRDLPLLDGLGRRAPLASAAITAGALSLMGAPLTLGFLGRWRLVEAGVGAGWWWAAGAVIVASLAGVFYGGRLIERVYFRRASASFEKKTEPWRFALAPALVLAMAVIAVGVSPNWLLRAAAAAAAMLTGAA